MPNSIQRWNFRKASWTQFEDLCAVDRELFDSPEDDIAFITDTIINAATSSIPLTKPTCRRSYVPWWNNQVSSHDDERGPFVDI